MNKHTTYKKYTIRLQPHQDVASEYAFTIVDPAGRGIKHVFQGGKTQNKALAKAMEIIDLELQIEQERKRLREAKKNWQA
jgi:hypothetical protein